MVSKQYAPLRDVDAVRSFVTRKSVTLMDLMGLLHEAGFHATAHKVHDALRELGWEASRILDKIHSPEVSDGR